MNKYKKYILTELKTIEAECRKMGISATEWVEQYAEEYHKKHWNDNMQSVHAVKKNDGNQSHRARWLEWVNNN